VGAIPGIPGTGSFRCPLCEKTAPESSQASVDVSEQVETPVDDPGPPDVAGVGWMVQCVKEACKSIRVNTPGKYKVQKNE